MAFDPGKLAKGLKNAEKLGGTAEAAKSLLNGVKDAASGNAPEQMVEALRKLIAEAKKLLEASGGNNKELEAGINKAQQLLENKELSVELVTKVTAELGALIKSAGAKQPAAAPAPANSEAAAAPKTERKPAAPTPPAAPAKTVQFTDVEKDAYYYDAVQWAVQNNIASGTSDTTFSPDQTCTRAQTITLIWRAEGSPAPKGQNNPFTDVADGAYYYQAVLWAAERGIVAGTAFDPDGAMTRGRLADFLYRNAGSPAINAGSEFADVPNDADFAKAVAWVAKQGITSGTGENSFSPDTACTRGQIVTFLYRAKK